MAAAVSAIGVWVFYRFVMSFRGVPSLLRDFDVAIDVNHLKVDNVGYSLILLPHHTVFATDLIRLKAPALRMMQASHR